MEEFTKNGRKLRPRKSAATDRRSEGPAYSTSRSGEHRNFGERRSYGEHRSFGEHKSYGERSERRPYSGNSEGRSSFGERRSFGEHRNYGEHKSFGERSERRPYSGNGEGRSNFGERRSFGEHKSFGERKNFGEHKNFGERSERRPYNSGKSFGKGGFGGGRRPSRSFEPKFGKASEEGIDRMISRRPLVSDEHMSDREAVKMTFSNEVRLNKFIANSGVCSRREADTLIQAGVVTVNGEVVTELGTKVNVVTDDIRFNGERLKGEEKVYIVMNKPKGYVTTTSDPHADQTVLELLKGCNERVFPVGRLDKATTGVLMFTNDGEIAERLTHPSYEKKKIYQVILDKELLKEDFDKILAGITLTDGDVAADELEYIDEGDHRKLGIEIHSGRNRIVRRIFESLGYDVKALDRVYFAGLTKKGLKKGEWRYLSEGEVNILRMGAYV